VPDRPGISASIFGPLAESHINVDMIVQSVSEDGSKTDMTFTVPEGDVEKAVKVLQDERDDISFEMLQSDTGLAKISVEIKFSLLIDADYTELAVRTLHAVYGLNQ